MPMNDSLWDTNFSIWHTSEIQLDQDLWEKINVYKTKIHDFNIWHAAVNTVSS